MNGNATRDREDSRNRLKEWLTPFAFFLACGWAVWHMPAYILDFLPPQSESMLSQISELHLRKDVTPFLPGLFGGYTDVVDWAILLLIPVLFTLGLRTVRVESMEFPDWRPVDRVSLFVGRVTMIMIISMTGVMLYEVFLRYALERPTLWANELTLWIAGFVFLCSGLYAMQQRCHIRIFILYDVVPRRVQHVFDIISVAMFALFAFFLVYGSYRQVFVNKFYRWEMFGTAFDPPIPATVQPMILIIVSLIAIQSVINLVCDWNRTPEVHHVADDIDREELEAMKRSAGAD